MTVQKKLPPIKMLSGLILAGYCAGASAALVKNVNFSPAPGTVAKVGQRLYAAVWINQKREGVPFTFKWFCDRRAVSGFTKKTNREGRSQGELVVPRRCARAQTVNVRIRDASGRPIKDAFWRLVAGAAGGSSGGGSAKKADGKRCTNKSQCQSGNCYPGPSFSPDRPAPKYCLARNMNCARPGSAGGAYGQRMGFKGKTLTCVNPAQYGWPGRPAQFMVAKKKSGGGASPQVRVKKVNLSPASGTAAKVGQRLYAAVWINQKREGVPFTFKWFCDRRAVSGFAKKTNREGRSQGELDVPRRCARAKTVNVRIRDASGRPVKDAFWRLTPGGTGGGVEADPSGRADGRPSSGKLRYGVVVNPSRGTRIRKPAALSAAVSTVPAQAGVRILFNWTCFGGGGAKRIEVKTGSNGSAVSRYPTTFCKDDNKGAKILNLDISDRTNRKAIKRNIGWTIDIVPDLGRAKNGQSCVTDAQCRSAKCYPGPSARPGGSKRKYCVAKDRLCAYPNSPGVPLGGRKTLGADYLMCLRPGSHGWPAGLRAQLMLPLKKGQSAYKAYRIYYAPTHRGEIRPLGVLRAVVKMDKAQTWASFHFRWTCVGGGRARLLKEETRRVSGAEGNTVDARLRLTQISCLPGNKVQLQVRENDRGGKAAAGGRAEWRVIESGAVPRGGKPNGVSCIDGSGCLSLRCGPGPVGNRFPGGQDKSYCMAKGADCSYPGRDGYRFNQRIKVGRADYQCGTSANGTRMYPLLTPSKKNPLPKPGGGTAPTGSGPSTPPVPAGGIIPDRGGVIMRSELSVVSTPSPGRHCENRLGSKTISVNITARNAKQGTPVGVNWTCSGVPAIRKILLTDANGRVNTTVRLGNPGGNAFERRCGADLKGVSNDPKLSITNEEGKRLRELSWLLVWEGSAECSATRPPIPNPVPPSTPTTEKLSLCVGAYNGSGKNNLKHEAYVTRGSCRDRRGGWYRGAHITLYVLDLETKKVWYSLSGPRYVNSNNRHGKDKFLAWRHMACARATASLANGRKLSSGIVCNRRSYE